MAPQEMLKLDRILEQLGEHREDFKVMQAELLGGDGVEKPTARIPVLESQSKSHGKRIRRIENFILMLVGAAGLLKALSWGAESLSHVVEVLRH
jgi:hypothetical protein